MIDLNLEEDKMEKRLFQVSLSKGYAERITNKQLYQKPKLADGSMGSWNGDRSVMIKIQRILLQRAMKAMLKMLSIYLIYW